MCVAVDNDTLVVNTVTVRDRDTMAQVRVSIDNLRNMVFDELKPKK
jgi:glycyl-tRNA synthetase